MMIFKKLPLLATLALSFVACVNEVDNTPVKPNEVCEVGFFMPVDATRTSLDPDGVHTRWSEGDKLAVWAKDSEGNYTFENASFMLRYFSSDYDNAFFTSNIAAMEEGEYTYYLTYPTPASTNGTQATYTLPAVQTGEYNGRYDVMIAEPVVEGALTSSKRVELNTIMRHQMHGIKITVPEGRNLYGDRFYRLEITFPNAVVGDIIVDVTNPDAEPTYSNTSNVVVLESAEGFDAGSEIWAFVLPGTIDGDVSYFVRGERRKSNEAVYHLTRTMERGHVTPINMAIPEIYPLYTAVTFSIDQNNLGEEFNFFDVYDANGNHMGQFARNAKNEYVVDYEGEFDADQYDNTSWRIVFDSEHAIVETTINLGDMTDYTEHTRWMNVPYLFAEDFSSVPTWTDGHDNPGTGESDLYVGITELSGQGLPGWYGTRIGMQSGAVRICGRYQHVIAAGAFYKGRLYTPFLSGLKDGASPQLRIEYNYSSNINESRPNIIGSKPNAAPLLYFGLDQQVDVVNMDDTELTSIITGGGYMDRAPTSLVITYINGVSLPTSGGSYTSIGNTQSMVVNNVTNQCRLAWIVSSANTKSNCNGNYWMYIDNIKVQIAK